MTDILTTPWRVFPQGSRNTDHVFAIGDVHGHADLLEAMLDHIHLMPADPDRASAIVFTGDFVDRGPENMRAIRLAMATEAEFDRRVILPGNHELMLLMAMSDVPNGLDLQLWYRNGGHALCDEVDPDGKIGGADIGQAIREALPEGFEDLIRRAPSHHVNGDLLFVHAGIPPYGDRKAFLAQSIDDLEREHWAWIRTPFLEFRGGWGQNGFDRTVVVHGHSIETERRFETADEVGEVLDRTTSHGRINIDAGSFAYRQLACLEACGDRYRIHVVQQ
ncbi:metallophosphoesterase [Palleronia sp.]|uniref:metallophosphoesterase n=1 Tax=Palleronia sp. TaxID=1940284 RepID=UPI0035C802EB